MELWVQMLSGLEVTSQIKKQYICINNDTKTNEQKVTRGVPQGSPFGSLLFLIYVNDPPSASNLLNTIMSTDDTSLFFGPQRQ